MKKYVLYFAAAAIAAAFVSPAQAQWSGSLMLGSGYDDNAFSNSNATASTFGYAGLELGYSPEEMNFGLNYNGTYATYGDFPDRRYNQHLLSASYYHIYGEDDKNILFTNGGFGVRIDAPEYNYYDHDQAYITLGVRHYLIDLLNVRTGYRLRYRSYTNFNDMSYTEHTGWFSTNTSFATRTSITLRAEMGIKQYSPFESITEYPTTGTYAVPGSAIDGGGGNGGGNGGSGGPGNGGNGNGEGEEGNGSGAGYGQGNGMHSGQVPVENMGMTSAQFVTYDDATTSQLRLQATVGQGITETTGLSIKYLKRLNLNDRTRTVIGGAVDFIGEEELFDDPYSYESDEATIQITQVIGERMKLKIAGYGLLKNYSYPSDLSNLDLTNVPMREDRRFGGWAMLSYTLPGDWLLFSGMEFGLGYTYTRNESNAQWYDYSANDVSFQIGTNF